MCINPKYPYFGASPYGVVSCACCGLGCIEIKCSFCAKDAGLEDMNILKKIGISQDKGQSKLSENHAYYYQIQMQLAITGLQYCDFVVWSERNFYHERFVFNQPFREKESQVANSFFLKVIVPELMGRHFTKTNADQKNINCQVPEPQSDKAYYCTCKGPDNGTPMIACANLHCPIEWFHLTCLGLQNVPDNPNWLCPSCEENNVS